MSYKSDSESWSTESENSRHSSRDSTTSTRSRSSSASSRKSRRTNRKLREASRTRRRTNASRRASRSSRRGSSKVRRASRHTRRGRSVSDRSKRRSRSTPRKVTITKARRAKSLPSRRKVSNNKRGKTFVVTKKSNKGTTSRPLETARTSNRSNDSSLGNSVPSLQDISMIPSSPSRRSLSSPPHSENTRLTSTPKKNRQPDLYRRSILNRVLKEYTAVRGKTPDSRGKQSTTRQRLSGTSSSNMDWSDLTMNSHDSSIRSRDSSMRSRDSSKKSRDSSKVSCDSFDCLRDSSRLSTDNSRSGTDTSRSSCKLPRNKLRNVRDSISRKSSMNSDLSYSFATPSKVSDVVCSLVTPLFARSCQNVKIDPATQVVTIDNSVVIVSGGLSEKQRREAMKNLFKVRPAVSNQKNLSENGLDEESTSQQVLIGNKVIVIRRTTKIKRIPKDRELRSTDSRQYKDITMGFITDDETQPRQNPMNDFVSTTCLNGTSCQNDVFKKKEVVVLHFGPKNPVINENLEKSLMNHKNVCVDSEDRNRVVDFDEKVVVDSNSITIVRSTIVDTRISSKGDVWTNSTKLVAEEKRNYDFERKGTNGDLSYSVTNYSCNESTYHSSRRSKRSSSMNRSNCSLGKRSNASTQSLSKLASSCKTDSSVQTCSEYSSCPDSTQDVSTKSTQSYTVGKSKKKPRDLRTIRSHSNRSANDSQQNRSFEINQTAPGLLKTNETDCDLQISSHSVGPIKTSSNSSVLNGTTQSSHSTSGVKEESSITNRTPLRSSDKEKSKSSAKSPNTSNRSSTEIRRRRSSRIGDKANMTSISERALSRSFELNQSAPAKLKSVETEIKIDTGSQNKRNEGQRNVVKTLSVFARVNGEPYKFTCNYKFKTSNPNVIMTVDSAEFDGKKLWDRRESK